MSYSISKKLRVREEGIIRYIILRRSLDSFRFPSHAHACRRGHRLTARACSVTESVAVLVRVGAAPGRTDLAATHPPAELPSGTVVVVARR